MQCTPQSAATYGKAHSKGWSAACCRGVDTMCRGIKACENIYGIMKSLRVALQHHLLLMVQHPSRMILVQAVCLKECPAGVVSALDDSTVVG